MKTNFKFLRNFYTLILSIVISLFNFSFAATSNVENSNINYSVLSLAPMLEEALPSVVSIKTEGTAKVTAVIPPEFQHFFGMPENQSKTFMGQGSGVIINAEKGYIVTNNHVIDNADKIVVQTNDGNEYTAKLLSKDPQTDIALLQIENAKNLKAMKMADSDKLRVGDYALAIGNPFGIGQTVTSGIISALARTGFNQNGFESFIQTDAAINRGNSGGALINLNGELIGINTAIFAQNGGNIGIGFAIPSNIVKNVTDQFINYGEAKRGFLGIRGYELSPDIVSAFRLTIQKGAFVSEVLENSAASEAGIKAGDVIISLNDKAITTFSELRARIATANINENISLVVVRESEEIRLTAKLKVRDEQAPFLKASELHPQLNGVNLIDGSLHGRKGIIVNKIEKDSPAAQIGLAEGDFIIGINKTLINNLNDFRKAVELKPAIVALNVIRGNTQMYFILR